MHPTIESLTAQLKALAESIAIDTLALFKSVPAVSYTNKNGREVYRVPGAMVFFSAEAFKALKEHKFETSVAVIPGLYEGRPTFRIEVL